MQPIHPLRYGAVNAADEAQDSARRVGAQSPVSKGSETQTPPVGPKVSQLPHQTAKLPHTPSFYPETETPAELIRTVATLLATLGERDLIRAPGSPVYLRFQVADVVEMRAKLATVYDALDASGQRYELTAQGRSALDRSVNDRGPLAKARHDSTQRDDAAWKAWVEKP